jgi:uncharacterized protein with HEPN domain
MSLETFLVDEKTRYAIVRALEVISETTKKLPASLRESHPQVPWRQMAGMRDKLVHDYFGINAEVVWKTAVEDTPEIAAAPREIQL